MACNWIIGEEIENVNYENYGRVIWGPPRCWTDFRGHKYCVPAPYTCSGRFITDGACIGGEKDMTTTIPKGGSLEDNASLDLTAWWTDDYVEKYEPPIIHCKGPAAPTFEIRDLCPKDYRPVDIIIDKYSKPKTDKTSPMRKKAICYRDLGGPFTFSGFPDCEYTDYVKNGFVVKYHYETITIKFDPIIIKNLMQKYKAYLLSRRWSEEQIKGTPFYFDNILQLFYGARCFHHTKTQALLSGVTLDHEDKSPVELQISYLSILKHDPQYPRRNLLRNWGLNWEYTIPNLATLNKIGIVSIECIITPKCFLTDCPLPPYTPTESYHWENWYYTDNTHREINRLPSWLQ